MSLPDTLGSPVTDLEEYLEPARRNGCTTPGPDIAATTDEPSSRRRLIGILGAGVAILALASAVTWAASRPAAATGVVAVAESPPDGLTGFAELFVTTYLTAAGAAEPDALDPFLAAPVDLSAMTSRQRYVPHAAAIDVDRLGNGYWQVTVAAEVLERRDEGYEPVGLQHYAVAIAKAPNGLLATALPARVSPERTVIPAGTYGDLRVEGDAELAAFADGFADALYAGSGMLPRFVTPSSDLEPLTPAPYTHIEVVYVAEGKVAGEGWVTIAAVGSTASGLSEIVTATVRLSAGDNGPRAEALLPGPPPLPDPDHP
jgi:hypothetical protein